jgi:hypothetical protein
MSVRTIAAARVTIRPVYDFDELPLRCERCLRQTFNEHWFVLKVYAGPEGAKAERRTDTRRGAKPGDSFLTLTICASCDSDLRQLAPEARTGA